MAALVQSYPQQSSTVTMLQTRPSSASGILQTGPQTQSHHPYPSSQHMQRNSFHGMNTGSMGMSSYRGQTVAPIAPYAFTSTPNLALPGQRAQVPHLRQDMRTSSAPSIPTFDSGYGGNRSRYPSRPSVSTTSSSSSSDLSSLSHKSGSRDDSALVGTARVVSNTARPHSTIIASSPTLSPPTISAPIKPSPDRYRRPNNRRPDSFADPIQPQTSVSTSSIPNVIQFYGNHAQQSTPIQSNQSLHNFQVPQFSRSPAGYSPGVAADDMVLRRNTAQDPAKRYRRRSIHTIDAGDYGGPMSAGLLQQGSRQVSSANGRIDQGRIDQHPLRSSPVMGIRPASSHGRHGSTESVNSTRSGSGHHSRPSSVCISLVFFTAFTQCTNYSSPFSPLWGIISLIR
jgi:hypothetical protein